jgi:hypothetical protein
VCIRREVEGHKTCIDADRQSTDGVEENEGANANLVKEWVVRPQEVPSTKYEFQRVETDIKPRGCQQHANSETIRKYDLR